MNDDYIRKDIHDEEIKHLREILSISLSDINSRIDDIKDNINRTFTLWSLVIGAMGLILMGIQIALAVFLFYIQR